MTPEEKLCQAIQEYARVKGFTFIEAMDVIIKGHQNFMKGYSGLSNEAKWILGIVQRSN